MKAGTTVLVTQDPCRRAVFQTEIIHLSETKPEAGLEVQAIFKMKPH